MNANTMILTLSDLPTVEDRKCYEPPPTGKICTGRDCSGVARHHLTISAPELEDDPEGQQDHDLCSMHMFAFISGAAFMFAELADSGPIA